MLYLFLTGSKTYKLNSFRSLIAFFHQCIDPHLAPFAWEFNRAIGALLPDNADLYHNLLATEAWLRMKSNGSGREGAFVTRTMDVMLRKDMRSPGTTRPLPLYQIAGIRQVGLRTGMFFQVATRKIK